MLAQVFWGANAGGLVVASLCFSDDLFSAVAAFCQKLFPALSSTRNRVAGDQLLQGDFEKLEPFEPATDSFYPVVIDRKITDHGQVGVDRMADGQTRFAFNNIVIGCGLVASFFRVDKRKCQCPHAVTCRLDNSGAIGAGHPQRWMGLLVGFR